jgi:type II secretory pathway component PulK
MKRSIQSHCGLNSRRGVVLVVVLVIVAMVAFAGFSFVASMSTEYEAVKLDGGRMQSEQTLASAETLMQWYVDLPPAMRTNAFEM